jgi:LacI family transcriptional regulator
MGVLAAFAQHGIRVPDDVSLVGFDDMAGAGFLVPALTTVRQDFAELGRRAVSFLLGELDAEARTIAPQLLVRSSTAAPR